MAFEFVKRIQVADKNCAVVEAQRDAVIAVARGRENLAVDAELLKKGAAFCQGEGADGGVIDRCERVLSLLRENRVGAVKKRQLQVGREDDRAVVRNLLRNPHVVRVKMRDQYAADSVDRPAGLLERAAEIRKCARPTRIKKNIACAPLNQVRIRIGITYSFNHAPSMRASVRINSATAALRSCSAASQKPLCHSS